MLNKHFKVIVGLLFLLLGALILSACQAAEPQVIVETVEVEVEKEVVVEVTPEGPEEVTLTVWHQFAGVEGGPWTDLKRIFQEINPHIKIDDTAFTAEDLQTAVTAAFPAGEGPDVVYYDASAAYLGAVIEENFAMDLTDAFKERGWEEKMFQWAQDKTTYNDRKYGVGGYSEIVGIFYNADLFEEFGLEPPNSWDNMIAAAERAKEEGLIPFAVGGLDVWPASHYCGVMVHAIAPLETIGQAELLEGEGSWTDPKMVEAAAECQKWVTEYGFYPEDVSAIAYQDATNDFLAGRSLMRIDGSWGAGDIIDAEFTARFVRFPEKDPANLPPQAEGGISSTWFINNDTDKVDAALTFLDFMVFSDIANAEFLQDGQLPSVAFDIEAAGGHPLLLEAAQAIEDVSTNGEGLGYWIGYMSDPIFIDYMGSGWQALLADAISPEEFAEGAAEAQEEARTTR